MMTWLDLDRRIENALEAAGIFEKESGNCSVNGRTVKARIGPFYAEGGTRRGTPVSFVTEVYADEI
ncbi:MAG: hypothetical protein WA728_31180 [Xanthobacteraceae bacterium]